MTTATFAVAPRHGRRFRRPGLWTLAAFAGALAAALPVGTALWLAFTANENVWPHLMATVLPGYIATTLILLGGVALGTIVIGVGTAWLVTMCSFPGRALLGWALMLPLAAPTYVVAYLYTGLLDYAGPVQSTIRGVFGFATMRDYWFPDIRSVEGAIAMMALTLYPYVYLLARAAFIEQGPSAMEASRTLGCNPWQGFRRVALPMARPAIAVGAALAMMETLNDFGTVDYFAVRTLTAGVYNVWLKMQNVGGAAQIALVMLAFVITLLLLEHAARRRQRYHQGGGRYLRGPRYVLPPGRAALAIAACALPVLLGFVVPAGVLLAMAIENFTAAFNARFPEHAWNSLRLAVAAALICLVMGTLVAYAQRLRPSRALHALSRVASLGYAIPGAVIALGVLIPFGALDNGIDALVRDRLGVSTGLLLSGTLAAVLFAYLVRFFALGFGSMESGLARVKPSMDMAARTLGHGPTSAFFKVHLPIVKGSALTALLIVFVDVMKELPATLVLRPFNFETLATQVYQHAATEQLELSALGALTIVAVGLIPVVLLNRTIVRQRQGAGGS